MFVTDIAKFGVDLSKKEAQYFINKKAGMFNEKYITGKGSGISITNNKAKDIIKVIRSLDIR